jgi:hypothetical protein
VRFLSESFFLAHSQRRAWAHSTPQHAPVNFGAIVEGSSTSLVKVTDKTLISQFLFITKKNQ